MLFYILFITGAKCTNVFFFCTDKYKHGISYLRVEKESQFNAHGMSACSKASFALLLAHCVCGALCKHAPPANFPLIGLRAAQARVGVFWRRFRAFLGSTRGWVGALFQ